jgi:uncharacterized protein (DUF1800 family)
MIMYLDNIENFGPNSRAIKKSGSGRTINENLAREILELHTLGLDNYDQNDVRSLAKILTGWRVSGLGLGAPGENVFRYADEFHEPGAQTLLSGEYRRTFGEAGQAQGLAALAYLAKLRPTANHIAKKLLVHFVKDDPSAEMIKTIADVFYAHRDSPTQLKEVAKALLMMDEAWTEPMVRIRPPNLWLVSVTRALAVTQAKNEEFAPGYRYYLRLMHNEPWRNRTPDGYSDYDLAWSNPGTVYLRMEIATQMVNSLLTPTELDKLTPTARFENLFPVVRSETAKTEIGSWAKKDKRTAMAFMLMTPEFMHR